MSRLTMREQVARFGMSREAACAIRDNARNRQSPADIKRARTLWQELAYEGRGNRGGPWLYRQHPEAVRVCMLAALAEGKTPEQAQAVAREGMIMSGLVS